MIKFSCRSRKRDGTPVVSDLEVMAFAEAQVWDYRPELLKEPGKLNALHFVESYLKATVDVQSIRHVVPGLEINGITLFQDSMVTVREEDGLVGKVFPAGTIIIDSTVIDMDDGFTQFTICHEGGHFCMHYQGDKVMCRVTEQRKWTETDFMEHQANVYAASVLMPRHTFVPFVMDLNRKAGHKDGIFVRPKKDPLYRYRHWYTFLEEIGAKVAETYGVSESAAFVHMKRCGLIRAVESEDRSVYIRKGIAV